MKLSEHFTLAELTRSGAAERLGIANDPSPAVVANLVRLCQTALEPLRKALGGPITVTSGYRSPALNAAIGGVATSAHMDGRAADILPRNGTLENAFTIGAKSPIPYDQIIIEKMVGGKKWIHLAIARSGEKPRRMVLSGEVSKGEMRYDRVATG